MGERVDTADLSLHTGAFEITVLARDGEYRAAVVSAGVQRYATTAPTQPEALDRCVRFVDSMAPKSPRRVP